MVLSRKHPIVLSGLGVSNGCGPNPVLEIFSFVHVYALFLISNILWDFYKYHVFNLCLWNVWVTQASAKKLQIVIDLHDASHLKSCGKSHTWARTTHVNRVDSSPHVVALRARTRLQGTRAGGVTQLTIFFKCVYSLSQLDLRTEGRQCWLTKNSRQRQM